MNTLLVVNYRVGFKSGAGYPVLFDGTHTLDKAREVRDRFNRDTAPGHFVFKVTIEEVK